MSRDLFQLPVIRDLQRLQRHRSRTGLINNSGGGENGSAGSCASSGGGSDDSSDYTTPTQVNESSLMTSSVELPQQTLAELELRMAQLESIFGNRLGHVANEKLMMTSSSELANQNIDQSTSKNKSNHVTKVN